jgi:branched-chain amino acid transport system ATP-binding protein
VTLLALEGLQTYYGEAHILQGVSLTVGAGEVVTLIGRNGAGKTTTLRSIMGLVPPRGGHITFEGRELTRLPTHEVARAGIAYVPEERRILPNLSVAEDLRLGLLGSRPSSAESNGAAVEEVLGYFPRLRATSRRTNRSRGASIKCSPSRPASWPAPS